MYKNEEEYEFFTQKLCKCGDIIPEGRVNLAIVAASLLDII